MTRALTAAALLAVVLTGGLIYGALHGFIEDTGPDWGDADE